MKTKHNMKKNQQRLPFGVSAVVGDTEVVVIVGVQVPTVELENKP